MKSSRPTIKDVARESGVSIATVSRVLNNLGNVAPETEQKVRDAIERLGYRLNAIARGLVSDQTQLIGVLITDVSNFFFAELFRGMEDEAHRNGFRVIVSNTDSSRERAKEYLRIMREHRVAGVIYTSEPVYEDIDAELRSLAVPVVLVATEAPPDRPYPAVKVDNVRAAADMVSYVYRKGHRRVGLISGPLDDPIAGEPRYRGFMQAVLDLGLTLQPHWVQFGAYRFHDGRRAMEVMAASGPLPTAVLCMSDEMALGVLSYAHERGIRVPEELSIVGFDNVRVSAMVTPPLTTMSQSLGLMGEQGMRLLIELIRTGQTLKSRMDQIVIPHALVERCSVVDMDAGRATAERSADESGM